MVSIDNYKVYIHTNNMNKKVYVGITCQKSEYRWRGGDGYKHQMFYKAIQKYGWDNFTHEVISSNLSKEEAEFLEISLILELHSNDKNFGYNVANGGNSTGTHTDETKNKIREYRKGKKASEETKEKIRSANKIAMCGKTCSEDTKKKISNLTKGENHPMYGKKHKEESIDKISESHKGGRNPRAQKVICEGVVFDCITECADYYGVKKCSMSNWLSGRCKMPKEWIERGLNKVQ